MTTRMAVFVDGPSFFSLQADKLRWWVDPKKLLLYLQNDFQPGNSLVDAYYYAVYSPEIQSQENFIRALAHMGYSVLAKEYNSAQCDLVADMINTMEKYDHVILVGHEPCYEHSLEIVQSNCKRVTVMSTSRMVCRELRMLTGMHFVDFKDIRGAVEKDGYDSAVESRSSRPEESATRSPTS